MGGAYLSSNFQLYGDMSSRVMEILEDLNSQMEVYSIDEAFLKWQGEKPCVVEKWGQEARKKILQWTGIPVSIGIGQTKTLAKLANHIAKKETSSGVFFLSPLGGEQDVYRPVPVKDIWGISGARRKRLAQVGVYTAQQLASMDLLRVEKLLTICGRHIVEELRGRECYHLEEQVDKKSISSSRSFRQGVSSRESLEEALSSFMTTAAEKLRKQKSLARGLYIYIRTSPHKNLGRQYSKNYSALLPTPTGDTRELIKAACHFLKQIYRPGYSYHKAGVVLYDLIPDCYRYPSLFDPVDDSQSDQLMKVVDRINVRLGSKTVFWGAQGTRGRWQQQPSRRSKRATTQWHELATVS